MTDSADVTISQWDSVDDAVAPRAGFLGHVLLATMLASIVMQMRAVARLLLRGEGQGAA
jgi:hypothetical protein